MRKVVTFVANVRCPLPRYILLLILLVMFFDEILYILMYVCSGVRFVHFFYRALKFYNFYFHVVMYMFSFSSI